MARQQVLDTKIVDLACSEMSFITHTRKSLFDNEEEEVENRQADIRDWGEVHGHKNMT